MMGIYINTCIVLQNIAPFMPLTNLRNPFHTFPEFIASERQTGIDNVLIILSRMGVRGVNSLLVVMQRLTSGNATLLVVF
jgi:hypothetical protein